MKRTVFLLYGVLCHVMFLGVYVYACAFVGNFLVPKTIDGEPTSPLWMALLINTGLIALFGVQHSVMARPKFKQWWTQYVPKPIERSTYVLISNVLMIAIFVGWQPMGGVIWDVQSEPGRSILYGLFAAGWLLVPLSSFMTDHFDLFGVRQVWLHYQGKPYTPLPFEQRGLYKVMRHPLYVGWIIAFWATPTMTAAHLLFATLLTVYILIALRYEERDLIDHFGEQYRAYVRRVRRFLPMRKAAPALTESAA